VRKKELAWQSKTVLLLVMPFTAAAVILEAHWWTTQFPAVSIWTVGLSVLLGIIVFKLRAATMGAAAAGAVITASLMFSTLTYPYRPWYTALLPVLTVSLLAHFATRIGRRKKEQLGTAEARRGRTASQIAANLGLASLVSFPNFQSLLTDSPFLARTALGSVPFFAISLAALAEAAADTVSSEIGQVFGGRPRMITTLRPADPGVDGGITLAGTAAGILAGVLVSLVGVWALRGGFGLFFVSTAGAVFGLFFDSLLGATLERLGWLNNDAVNFLSTASAAAFALAVLAFYP
jgi:uncharacterized protein (TIGR00297 family)